MIFQVPRITFFLRSNKAVKEAKHLFCRVTYKGTKTEFSLREKIDPVDWDQEKQKMKGRSAQSNYVNMMVQKEAYNLKAIAYNSDIVDAKELVYACKKQKKSEPKVIDILSKYIDQESKTKKASTIRNHTIKLKNLQEYQKSKKRSFYPSNFDTVEAERFKTWFMERAKTTNVDAANRNVLLYRQAMYYAYKKGDIDAFDLINYKGERDKRKPNVFLTEKEVNALENLPIQNRMLHRMRDLFLFQCYTGLSYADIWKGWKIESKKDKPVIIGERAKNGQKFFVPLNSKALLILEKYPEGLPRYCNITYNRNIKEVAALANIDKKITTHTARKTFATLQDSKGWSRESVAQMLGHKKLTTTESYYIGATFARVENEMIKRV